MPDDMRNAVVQLQSLTRSDLLTLDRVAHSMIIAGLWISADRSRDAHCDCINVITYDVSGAALSIGVLASGRYFYMNHRSSEVCLGEDLDDVLIQAGLSV
jgi:hypothetical protein